jgi:hypothetical protein
MELNRVGRLTVDIMSIKHFYGWTNKYTFPREKNETRETAQGIQQEMRFSIVSRQDNRAIMLDDVRNHLHSR